MYVCMYVCMYFCMYVLCMYMHLGISPLPVVHCLVPRLPSSTLRPRSLSSMFSIPIDIGSSPEVDFSEAGIMLPRRKGDGRSSAVGRIIRIKSQGIIRIRTSSSKEEQRAVCSLPQTYPTLRKKTEIMHHTA